MKLNPMMMVAMGVCLLSASTSCAQTADPAANLRTKALLAYIQGLTSRTDKRVLSGQFLNFAPNASMALPEAIHAASGKWPAYVGVDYMNFGSKGIDTAAANRVARLYWHDGGLVQVNVHLPDPANPNGGGLRDPGVDLRTLLPGGAVREAWLREMDAVAAGLAELQGAGVVVLWRPFHEMNGKWFWWGGKPTADFVALWQDMFRYFSAVKGLHNLIWIYSPNKGDNAGDFYPGSGFADMVGLDAYTDDVDPVHITGAPALLATGKPFGFGEFGPHGASDPPGTYDYPRFARGLSAQFPRAVFFMSWNEKWSPARNLGDREFYNDPLIVTRDDLPRSLFN